MPNLAQGGLGCCGMRAVLDYCTGAIQRNVPAGTLIIHEGATTGHLYVLIEGRLEVSKGDAVVASITEPGAIVGEMSVLLGQPHTATVRAASDFNDLRVERCRIVLARPTRGGAADRAAAGAAAQCRHHLSRRHHASICRSRRSPRDGRRDPAEHDQPAADQGLARLGSAIRLRNSETIVCSGLNVSISSYRSPPGAVNRAPWVLREGLPELSWVPATVKSSNCMRTPNLT